MMRCELKSRLGKEERLLLACARTRIDPQKEAEIHGLASDSIDWDRVVRKAEEHSQTGQVQPMKRGAVRARFAAAPRAKRRA